MKLDLEHYTYERRKPTSVQQCIDDLVHGHPTAEVYMYSGLALKRYIERNSHLLQWPLVRYKYAELLMIGCLVRYPDGSDELVECDEEGRGMTMMLPLAKAGLATAQYEVGWALTPFYSKKGKDHETAVQWVIKASRQDYWCAQNYLENVWDEFLYLEFSDSTLWDFLVEIARFSKRYQGSLAKDYLDKIGWDIKNLDRDRWFESLKPPSYLLIPGVNTPPVPKPPLPKRDNEV